MNQVRLLSDFDILSVIGSGSYGKVLKIREKDTKTPYALKVLQKRQYFQENILRYIIEEKEVFRISVDHPFLATLLYCFQTPGSVVFIMEYIEGDNLKNIIVNLFEEKKKLGNDEARFYAAEISVGLDFLHQKGIIYRDLKLSNIMLDNEGHIKIVDYGYCKSGISRTDFAFTFLGSRLHRAPEINKGDGYNGSVDWWALGVMIFEMLTAYNPFSLKPINYYNMRVQEPPEEDMRMVAEAIAFKPVVFPEFISEEAKNIIELLLTKDPHLRLGCRYENGFVDVQEHPFFRSIDWNLLSERKFPAPNIIQFESGSAQETYISINSLLEDSETISNTDQVLFEEFDWINPNYVDECYKQRDFH